MKTKLKPVFGRVAGIAAALVAAAALTLATAPAASAVPSSPDEEWCPAEYPECPPDQWDDPAWPPPAQYRATGRDVSLPTAINEALGLVRTPCPKYDVLRMDAHQEGSIWVFTLTDTCN